MGDDVLLNKAASIERCVARARDGSVIAIIEKHTGDLLGYARRLVELA